MTCWASIEAATALKRKLLPAYKPAQSSCHHLLPATRQVDGADGCPHPNPYCNPKPCCSFSIGRWTGAGGASDDEEEAAEVVAAKRSAESAAERAARVNAEIKANLTTILLDVTDAIFGARQRFSAGSRVRQDELRFKSGLRDQG